MLKKNHITAIITGLIIILSNSTICAQQCLSGGCTTFGSFYPNASQGAPFTPPTSWQRLKKSDGNDAAINGGNYTTFNVVSGNIYEWSYCEDYGGVSASWDAQLTLFKESNLSSPICRSTDQCGTNGLAPYISWTADFTGVVRLLTTAYINGTGGCLSNSSSPYNKLMYRQIQGSPSCTTPGTPASATGSATGTTTASLSWTAGSPTGSSTVTYYWVVGTSSTVTYGNGVAEGSSTGTTATATGLSCGTNYYLRVYAKTNCDNTSSGYKTSASFTTNTCSNNSDNFGVDISHYNGTMGTTQWNNVLAAGKTFAYIKATEGKTTDAINDPYFTSTITPAVNSGVKIGAYHVMRPSTYTAVDEATHFLNTAGNYIGNGYLPPALDLETTTYNNYTGTPYQLAQWINTWATQVYNYNSKHIWPVLYTSTSVAQGLYQYYQNQTINSGIKLWIADPGGNTSTNHRPPGQPVTTGFSNWPWLFHQWYYPGNPNGGTAGNDPVEYHSPGMDQDFFYGDLNALVNGTTTCQDNYEPNNSSNQSIAFFTTPLSTTANCNTEYSFIGSGDQDWYQIPIDMTGTLQIDLTSLPKDYDIELYPGSGCSGSLSGGATESPTGPGHNSGTTDEHITYNYTIPASTCFYAKVYPKNNGVYDLCDSYRLNICWTPSSSCTPPTNDNCSGAITLTPATSCSYQTYTTTCATQSVAATSPCNGFTNGNADDDVWFKFSATAGTAYTVKLLNGTNFDGVVEIRTGACNGASVQCDDQTGSTGVLNQVSYTPTSNQTLYVRVYNYGSGSGGGSFQICVTQTCTVPGQPVSITGNTTVCSGSSQTYSISAVTGATSYVWSYSGSGTPSGTGTSVTFTPTTSGTLSVVAKNSCGNSTARTINITVNTVPAQPVSITGNSTACSGSSQTYSISAVAGAASYVWSYSGSGTPSGTGTSVTFTPTTSGTLSVVAKNSCGNSTTRTLSITIVSGTPAQPGSITGNTTVCSGSSQTYSISAVTGATSYTWSYSGSGAPSGTGTTVTFTPTTSGTLSVVAKNSCGNSTARTINITVNTVPAQPVSITGNTTVCSGSSQTYSISAVTGATSYVWSYSGSGAPSGTGTTVTFTPTTSGTLSVVAKNSCGNSTARIINITVNTVPAQPVSITGNSTACSGSSQTYSISAVAGATSYVWSYSGSGTPSGTGTSVTFTPTTSGTLSVVAKNSCGNSTTRTLSITIVSGTPAQPGSITGNTTVCSGSSQTYSISAVTGATSYTWSYSGSGAPSGTGTTVTFTPTTSGTLSVVAKNSCGNSTARTINITVNTVPAQPVSITGNTTVCSGSSQTYSISAVTGATSYTWSYSGSGTPSGTGTTVTFTPTTSGTLSVVAKNSCGNSTARTINITVNTVPAQPVSITGNSTACSGSSQTYSISAVAGATSYVWSYSGSGTPSGTGTSVTFTPTTSGTLSVVAKNSCGNSTTRTLSITIVSGTPAQPGSITGNTTVCSGSSQTYSISAVTGATSYTWSYSGSGAPSGTGTTVTFTPTTSGTLSVVAKNSCGNSTARTINITVNTVPAQPVSITGNTTVCSGSSQTYSISAVTGATSYTWSYSGSGAPSGTGTTVTFTPTTSGTLSVIAKNNCGNSTAKTINVTVKVSPTVAAISGSSSICGIGSTITLSNTTTGGTWNSSNTNVATIVPNGNSVTVKGIAAGTTTISYILTANGCSTVVTKTITVNTTGTAAIALISANSTKDQTVCKGTDITLIKYSITDGGSGATISGQPVGISGSYVNGVFTISGVPTAIGIFHYMVTTTGTCTSTKDTGTIVVNPIPATPTITQHNDTLYSSVTTCGSFKWYKGGTLVATTTVPYYKVPTSGSYTVVAVCGDCSSTASTAFSYSVTGIINYTTINAYQIYPNPASQVVNIGIQTKQNTQLQLRIFDVSGKEMYSTALQLTKGENIQTVDVSYFSKGIYMLQLAGTDGFTIDKFVVE